MPYRYLARIASRLPMFVTAPSEVRRLRRLASSGHVEASFYPPDAQEYQFGKATALLPAGRMALAARNARGKRDAF